MSEVTGTMRRSRWAIRSALAILVLAIASAAAILFRPRSDAWSDAPAGAQRLLVTPFHRESRAQAWAQLALEDSLAARLSAHPRLVAQTTGDAADADYVLEGDISPDGDRIVITLRLRPAGQRAAAWTATFWRTAVLDSALATDLAVAVGEAMRGARP